MKKRPLGPLFIEITNLMFARRERD